MHEGEGRGIERAPLERTHLDPSAANVGYADAEPARAFPRYSPPWRRALNQVIETEILPRLMMAHRAKAPGARKPRAHCPPCDVDAFTFALVDPDATVAPRLAERYRDDGASIEAVFLDLLAPAARKLGKMWETDERDFVEITVGLGRLHQIVGAFRASAESFAGDVNKRAKVLLLLSPGEGHGFGLEIVDCLLQAAGYRVRKGDPRTYLDELRREDFDLVGFSISCARNLPALESAVRQARAASRNRSIWVIAGGPIFVGDPELARNIGVDGVASDGDAAIQLARSLLDRR